MAGFTIKHVYGPLPYGDQWAVCKKVSFDDNYATGGASLTFGELGMRAPKMVRIENKAGYNFEYDMTNKKVIVYVEEAVAAGGPLLELANATDLDAIDDVFVEAIGQL